MWLLMGMSRLTGRRPTLVTTIESLAGRVWEGTSPRACVKATRPLSAFAVDGTTQSPGMFLGVLPIPTTIASGAAGCLPDRNATGRVYQRTEIHVFEKQPMGGG